jgi:aerobic-type carbon monoxide dehydrogenase small subunit (CoxS/CutS family)
MRIALTVNGERHLADVEPGRVLADVIRADLELTGTKVACGEGTCGSCTVILDGRAVLACLTLAAACDGASVRTVEGEDDTVERLRAAFIAHDAFQCGFCTPGQLMSAAALLERVPRPTPDDVREAMSGNLCRCGAYEGIVEAVVAAGRER